MNYSLAFTFVKEEKDWIQKILVTGLILLIPIVGALYLVGWMFEITRRIARHETPVLPEVDFSKYIGIGFKAIVVAFVYMLPCTIVSIFSSTTDAILSNSRSDGIVFLRTVTNCGFGLINFVLWLALSFVLIAAYIRFLDNFQISSAFNFAAVWKTVTSSAKDILILWLFNLLSGLIASVGLVFCFIGIIFTAPYASAVWGNLLGQAKEKIG